MYDPDEINDFLRAATRVHDVVTKLANTDEDVDQTIYKEVDNLTKEISVRKEEELKKKESSEAKKIKFVRKGKGMANDYDYFCRVCFLELKGIETDPPKCPQCGGNVITRLQRQNDISAKVSELKIQKELRKRKKASYLRHQANIKTGKIQVQKGGTDYAAWDFWEPDSDDDAPPVTPNTPEFKAMEADMLARAEQREKDFRQAMEHKQLGNGYFKKKDWKKAEEYYTKGIKTQKDAKVLYTNRAMVYLKMNKPTKAIKDCTTVLDIWEYLNDKKPSRDETVVKALVRRCQAYRSKRMYAEALKDIQQACSMRPIPYNKKLEETCEKEYKDHVLATQALDKAKRKSEHKPTTDTLSENSSAEKKGSHCDKKKLPFSSNLEVEGSNIGHVAEIYDIVTKLRDRDTSKDFSEDDVAKLKMLKEYMETGTREEKLLFRKAKGFGTMCAISFGNNQPCDIKEEKKIDKKDESKEDIEEIELLESQSSANARIYALDAMVYACDVNPNRQHCAKSKRVLPGILTALSPGKFELKTKARCMELLVNIAMDEDARSYVCKNYGEEIMETISRNLKGSESKSKSLTSDRFDLYSAGLNALCNLAHDIQGLKKVLVTQSIDNQKKVVSSVIALLSLSSGTSSQIAQIQASALSALGNLSGLKSVRQVLSDTKTIETLNAILYATALSMRKIEDFKNSEILTRVLAVMLNLSIDSSSQKILFRKDYNLVLTVVMLLDVSMNDATSEHFLTEKKQKLTVQADMPPPDTLNIMLRLLLLLRRGCKYLREVKQLQKILEGTNILEKLMRYVRTFNKNENGSHSILTKQHIAGTLAHCIQLQKAQTQFRTSLELLQSVVMLLQGPKGMEGNVDTLANTAVVISILGSDKKAAKALQGAIPPLISALRMDGNSAKFKMMQQNCARALAKLATEPTNLLMIRKLHGIEMMARIVARNRS
eukprot:CAMPEP_0167759370 /NCGR_PEP_ID=MMETSP0110_2-20121227/10985_1 /TAXON_ID=629695 /ORGANISM="Gymnochlora sp., Strain CCMP2014" /LENGTH=942 /DNA_ID=CAMNT_0007645747 /DNA_START=78 /DNA_END=2906 /DNA_ORIENTATION=+